MSNKGKCLTSGSGVECGKFKISQRFREALSEAVRGSKYSREEIVSLLHGLTGHKITKQFFDQMTAPSKINHRFPAELLPAFCFITGNIEPLKILIEAIGFEMVDEEESKELNLLRLMKEKERIEKEIEKLKGGK
ncbi:hypothetical protein FHQ18_11530 [Deferribacter autotrophicus]|uniref:Uncharacterized protein n=1 Tax=Deferribacter autotrophicus TaxID=500465 RepID=A0A5A8F6C9_9BACT|nr:hypothetical protein [Deferribacter autotrophicus]KAA0257188.1 hypothetical protein FHQ18_11530 [Deferribacter autotrophicus]